MARPRNIYLTSERAAQINAERWRHDGTGLETVVSKLVKRAPALTAEQAERIRAALAEAER